MPFMTESDAAIVRRTLEGRPEAFEPLVFRYQRKALALARAAGLGPEAASDAVQEAFLQSFRDLPCLRDPARFGAWFLSIVRNVSRKTLERQPTSRSLSGDRPSPLDAEPVERKDFSEYLKRKVSELPEGIREAIFLYYYEGRKVREVARALSITRWGVKRRLKSGREILRGRLWQELEECLRDMLPSAREWRKRGGRLGLLILASVPFSWASRAGVSLPTASGAARWAARIETGSLVAAKKTAISQVALGLLLMLLGGGSWVLLDPWKQTGEDGNAAGTIVSRRVHGADHSRLEEPSRAARPAVEPKTVEELAAGAPGLDPEDVEYERSLGSVLIRLVWEEDGAPAAGVRGVVYPWASPALYIDEREFISGVDGAVLVNRIYKGGASIFIDRGGRLQVPVHVNAGEESEIRVEVPRGLNVEGVVVERSGIPVSGALVWISYNMNTNRGHEVATSAADGSFRIRSVASESFIAARAPGYAPSLIRQLKGEAGAGVQVRIVLPGRGGAVSGTVHDSQGNPVSQAKVMVGPEFPSWKTLEDGTDGLSAPPYVVYTGVEGRFRADSVAPGETRVAVCARGFVPLEGTVEVKSGACADVDVVLSRGATLAGTVTGADGRPIHGAHVAAGDFNHLLAVKIFSSRDGSYRLRGLPPGEVEVFAEREGRGKASTRLFVKGREMLRWDPVLSNEPEILGRVVDESGAGLEGFRVVVEEMLGSRQRFRSERQEKTGEGGRFRIAEASDLAYRLLVYEPLGAFPCAVIEELRPGPGELLVQVERDSLSSAYLLGRVLDPAGIPVCGAKVLCFGVVSGYGLYFTDKEEGRFKAGPLPKGGYRLEIQVPGYPARECEKKVLPREVVDLGDLWLGVQRP